VQVSVPQPTIPQPFDPDIHCVVEPFVEQAPLPIITFTSHWPKSPPLVTVAQFSPSALYDAEKLLPEPEDGEPPGASQL
jgi:hypothetical protein